MQSKQLFRTQALTSSSDSRFGPAVFYQPISLRLMVMALFGVLSCFLLFATLAEIRQTQPVRGQLKPVQGEVKIYSHRSGILHPRPWQEGQLVRAGEVLAVISDRQYDAHGNEALHVQKRHLQQQESQIRSQLGLQEERFLIDQHLLEERSQGYARELQLLREEHAASLKRLALAAEEYERNRTLFERQLISPSEHNRRLSEYYDHVQASNAVQLQVAAREQALNETQQQLLRLPLETEAEVLQLQRELSRLASQAMELESREAFAIIAPTDGRISNLIATTGDFVDTRTPILTLVAEDQTLEAELFLPSRALARVEPGLQLTLYYDAYPYRTYGGFAATIRQISESTIDPREFLILPELQEAVYVVSAELDQQFVATPALQRLRSGMQFSAEIVVGSESVLDRMMSPLTSLGRKL